jgi:hypothetical protein
MSPVVGTSAERMIPAIVWIVIEQNDARPRLNIPVRLPQAGRRAVFMVGWVGRFRQLSRPFFARKGLTINQGGGQILPALVSSLPPAAKLSICPKTRPEPGFLNLALAARMLLG